MTTSDGRLRGLTLAFLVMLAFAITAVAVGSLYVGLRAGDQSEKNQQVLEHLVDLSEEVHVTNERLLDCTEPGGECFKESQQRTGAAVTGIGDTTFRVIVAALSCQNDGITQEKKLARCTAKRLQVIPVPKG